MERVKLEFSKDRFGFDKGIFTKRGSLTGLVPICMVRHNGAGKIYLVSKTKHPINMPVYSKIMYDQMMGTLKDVYEDEFGREIWVYKTIEGAENKFNLLIQ